MTSGLQPYPEYKETGLPWLGRLPKHWRIRRGKYLFRCVDIRSSTGKEELLTVSSKHGIVPRNTMKVTMFKAESYIGHKLCWPNDLVINSLWAWACGLGVTKHYGIISSAYGVYRLQQDFESYANFIHHLVRSATFHWELRVRSKGVWTSRLQLTDDAFLGAPIPLPPQSEANKIVRFITAIENRINRFIRNRRQLIAVLNEQKQAIINSVVTRGLDPDVPLKSSGIEWLGDIPEQWEVRRIKTIAKILRGKFSHRPRNDPSLYDGEFPFIQTGDVARSGKYITKYKQTLNKRGYDVSKEFPKGTLTMTIAANIGDVAILDFNACFPDSIVGFVPKKEVFLDFLFYLFSAMKKEFLKEAPVNTQGNLNIERIGSMFVALPDYKTQQFTVAAIESELKNIDRLISYAQREIDLIHEYRTRLITDVVTGKLDVRHLSHEIEAEPAEQMGTDEYIDNEEPKFDVELTDNDD